MMKNIHGFGALIAVALIVILPGCGGGGSGGKGDITPPVTTVSPETGIYGSAQSITLSSDEPATIYYSVDGNMPSVGGANTISGPSPIRGVPLSSDTSLLQFFSVDASGNREPVRSETYVVSTGDPTGPGDPQNYFPLSIGNLLGSRGTSTVTGSQPVPYTKSISITGTRAINGVTAIVSRESNSGNPLADVEEYLLKNSHGITYLGNNDQSDTITPRLVPFQAAVFPLTAGSSFVQIRKTGLDSGTDFDLDGENEAADINSVVTVAGLETATVPAGTFPNSVRLETDSTVSVTLSSDGTKITVRAVQTQWFAPGIGPVKSVTTTIADGLGETDSEELIRAILAATFFGQATNFTPGSNPNSVAVADFNGDGAPDMAVTNQGDPSSGYTDSSVSILLGGGSGSFGPAGNFLVGTYAISAAVADFDGDGRRDLVVANFGSANVSILLGNGDGTFGAATNLPLAAQLNPTSVATGDFNGDGRPDLAVAVGLGFGNATPGHVSILLGNGDGTFGTATNFTVGGAPTSVAVGDFNSDGGLDLAVANSLGGSVSTLLGDGSGSFSTATNIPVADRPASVVIADFNGDGYLDLAVATNTFLVNDSNVSILLGTGTGSFGAPTSFVVDPVLGSNLHSVASGDFNGDGIQDLSVAREGSSGERGDNISILQGAGTGSFSPIISFVPVSGTPASIAIGDFNQDGKPDIASAMFNQVSVFLNTSP